MALVEAPRIRLPDPGQKGDPVAPVVQAYQALGVIVSHDFISQLRARSTSGAEIVRAVDAAEIVRENSAPSRDLFFIEYGVAGVTQRSKPKDRHSKTFGYKGLTKKLTQELGVSEEVLGCLVKASRIDLFYTPVDQLGVAFPANFRETVEVYLADLKKYNPKLEAEALSRIWNKRKTVKNFNAAMLRQPRWISAAWTPYEVEPLRIRATNRLVHHSSLTPFDIMVLTGIDGDRSDGAIIARMKSDIGITVPRQVVDFYRALLMGRIKANTQKTNH